ncbi:MAG TPA: imidazole glycerol phosphate synthase subunit HisF [Gemmatimonadaceae bacterium]
MLTRRVVVCLDVQGDRVVKGVRFEALRDVGDPVRLAERYEREGADEIVFLDISASAEERATLLDLARRAAERLFVPLTIGGGVRELADVVRACRAGADKVGINTAAVRRPELLTEAADRFGSQCVVASIDAKSRAPSAGRAPSAEGRGPLSWEVYVQGGRTATTLDAVEWARECVRRGAGEILLTSIDRDGARSGYDLELTRAVARAVDVPVIASGGAGSAEHVRAALREGEADAALVAGILHDGLTTVAAIKDALAADGLPVRRAA